MSDPSVHSTLLVSLGTSPAIVQEAYLLPETEFAAVHVLTTERPEVELIQQFFELHAPQCPLTITRVADFADFGSEQDHFRFEEVLYRWILNSQTKPEERYICLSGGFKTMSAAMQKAAAVLGAAEVFHVLADSNYTGPRGDRRPPSSIEEVLEAEQAGQLHWIRLGPEAGWPQLRDCRSDDYQLEVVQEQSGVRSVRTADHEFSERLKAIVQRSHRIAGAWNQLNALPFSDLATWAEADLKWLGAPFEPASAVDRRWVDALPKVELHCHLGGFATSGELLDQVRAAADQPDALPPMQDIVLASDWPTPARPVGLECYRHLGDNNGSALLRDRGCLSRQCRLLYEHFLEQNLLHAEVRCSPANYADATRGRSPWIVLADIRESFQEAMTEAAARHLKDPTSPAPCHVNLIIIGTRQTAGDYRAGISRHIALAVTAAEHWTDEKTCRVMGVDLAGYEDKDTRAHYFREEFTAVHRQGLALTVHAGENDDAEGIWRAVFDLNARRLGHALSLAQSPELLRSVADRGIGIEMCPYANYQIKGFAIDRDDGPAEERADYPLLQYLRAGARVTVNTDNIGISAASITENLLLAARLCPGLTRLDLLLLQRHAVETAFLPAAQRLRLAAQIAAGIPRP